ncbi:NADH-ubiquinone oxidoreductase-F iron-sulfur binding region domain-containing protein [Natranaerofaba carboxydovora]|uniref:NADH-ubiquinone oxidoreductase-F iron-sulfur binding region domain-containing protein n=1 Tax=Natranaerofaba carboxydovora TaxID=2742683 RepID=UPI001F12DAB0|nr:NADH-ubiquinone oxidoreductase-F iron-sulfur binding region domain-containing protein [Natranaerofaba carboxydovora]UMZ74143.1 NADP-reducing hydrogenase subunit HndC [Natranaerofaba carboxydovora]
MSSTSIEQKFQNIKKEAEENIASLDDKTVIYVGSASCGLAAGAKEVKDAFINKLDENNIEAEVKEVGCMGFCYAEPIIFISRPGFPTLVYGYVDEGLVESLIKNYLIEDDPCFEFALVATEVNDFFPTFADFPRGVYEEKQILNECGFIDPEEIDHYVSRDGYQALSKALSSSPVEILEEVKNANLRGRGGAGFPAGKKWEACLSNDGDERYVICNADEGDPGAFMDRIMLESNPHMVIEGMVLCAYTIGAKKGYLYIRSEYPQAVKKVQKAIEQAKEKNLLGDSILGSDFSFDLEVFQGAGAFVCGEATALIESMEGGSGIPQTRPPRMAQSGYKDKPTVLNNVKTFAYVPLIINNGSDWFKSTGTEGNPGTAVFALVGKINNTGLVEVPMGTTLRTLIYDVGEGIPGEKEFKAVQIGGPSGGCLPESALDIPIDFDSLGEAGAMMGSGGLVVMDENDCMVTVAKYFLEFTQQESCGKCTFCRLGTKQMLDILTDITKGEGTLESLELLEELAVDIKDGSLCNLGKTAPNPVLTTLRYFKDEYLAHINDGVCPAKMCQDLIVYYIVPERCSKLCSACVGSCPTEAIYTRDDGLKAIEQEKCVKCDNCLKACPPEYYAVEKLSPPEKLKELEEKEGN